MFELDPNGSYMMPAHFGQRPFHPNASGWYHDVTAMTVTYLTDAELLARFLPQPFTVAEQPLITVFYACNRRVDWLAGHGYNMVGVSAAANFNGEDDQLAGQYTLVMWENLTDPILTGRELQGIPKIYADIPDHSVVAGQWRATASHFGHTIVDLEIADLQELTAAEIASGAADQPESTPMAWRHLPQIGGFGTAVTGPTAFPSENRLTSVSVGSGRVDWHELTWEQNPTQFHIVNALAELPVLEYGLALVTEGSTNLIVPDRLPRALS